MNIKLSIILAFALAVLSCCTFETSRVRTVSSFAIMGNNTLNSTGAPTLTNITNSTGVSYNTNATVSLSSPNTRTATDGGSVDVMVQPSPFPLTTGDSKIKISFLQPSSENIQVHVDYDVVISQSNKEVFRASAVTGQPLLHTAEGVVTIPYKSEKSGNYTLDVSVMGINFVPIRTEYAKFDFSVK